MLIRCAVFLILFFHMGASVFADVAKDDLFFRAIRLKDGLPGSTVSTIEQDQQGFIWIGTNDGLCRFDGVHFKTYRHEHGNEQSLSDNFIQNLFIDRTGNLWIMTAAGLDYFDLEKQTFLHYRASEKPGTIADNSPTGIIETGEGNLYISSYYQGISIKKAGETTFSYLNENSSGHSKLTSNWISCMEQIDQSTLFIGYREHGVDIHNLNTGETSNLDDLTNNRLSNYRVNTILNHAGQAIWIGTNAGLSYFHIKTNKLLNFDYRADKTSFLTDNDIISLFMDDQANLWIGTRNSGLIIVNSNEVLSNGNKAKAISYKQDFKEGSLSYRSISSIFQDKDKHIWIGTHGGGINFVENRNERFGHLKHEEGEEMSLSYNKIWGISEDLQGNLWLGTDGDGLNVWNPKQATFRYYRNDPLNPYSLSNNAVISACTDYLGNVWLGTYEGGLNRFDQRTQRFYRYQAPQSIPVNDVRCIYEDTQNQLWIGMNQGGIAKYNREQDQFEPINEFNLYDIRSIHRTENLLWLGTFGEGLLKFDLQTHALKVFFPDADDPNSISSTTILSILQTNDSLLWLGTRYGGLVKLNLFSERFKAYGEKDGLANNTVHSILEDDNNNLWLSTNNSISKFDVSAIIFTNYGWSSGVQSEEFHNGSGLVTRDGLFCFGGISGFNYFNPSFFQTTQTNPNIHFTGLKILNQEVLPQKEGIINKSIEFRPKVNLTQKHTVFTIEFQSVTNPFPEEIYYEYFLENYDNTWNKAGNQNSATYRNLPAGEYRFRVRTIQNNTLLETEEAYLSIQMHPPFWRTWWAYLLYFALTVIIVVLFFRYRVQQFKIKNRLVYEQRLRSKEKKLHGERLEFFTNISHELRTPLTIISVAIDDLNSLRINNPRYRKSLEAATSNSNRLMELINRLLEFRQTETGVSSIKVKQLNLNTFFPEYLHGFREMAKHNEVNLKLSLPINDLFLWADSDKLNMILNNLLSNAFKHTPSGGEIILSIDQTESHILVKVQDNGEGISPQLREKIFKRYFKLDSESTSTGIGLALTKALVDLHNGTIEVDSKPGKGACFTVRFQKGNKHFAASQLDNDQIVKESDQKDLPKEEEEFIHTINNKQKIILLIDDNKEILELLNDKLEGEYRILKAENGTEGKKLAFQYIPDLIISDIMMPGISGTELCNELKNDQATSHIPIILLTAKGAVEDEIIGLKTGADDYISKPFKVSILMARIHTIIENRVKLIHYFSHQSELKASEETDPQKEKEFAFLNKIEEYILNNYLTEEISVFDLAAQLGYSRTTLYRKIKMLTGQSINSFVRSVRLKKSATLISEGMNVSEAAYSTGFNDLKYFRESFKKLFGKNPSEFKN